MDDAKIYDEDEFIYLCAFAGTYREVRGALQTTRTGRDHKKVRTDSRNAGKGKNSQRTPFVQGQAPKKHFPEKKTLFKAKGGGKSTRIPASELLAY